LGAERVEIQPGGRVVGLIETQVLVIVPGAIFEGDCRMGVTERATLDVPARG
jgi:cytoskeletal protein CcmA (bactofilin family)